MTIPLGLNALFLHFPYSGTGRYLNHLVDGLVDLVELHLIGSAAFPGVTTHSWSVSRSILRSPLDRRLPHLAKVWFEQIAFGYELRRMRLGLGHVPYFAPPLIARVPIVVTVHDLVPILDQAYRRTLAQRLYSSLVVAGLHSARLVITDSAASQRDLTVKLRIPPSHIRVIPLGVDERFHPARDADERARAASVRHACGVTEPYLVCVTGFDRRKNVNRLIEAFARLCLKKEIKHHLVVVGALRPGQPLFFDPRPTIENLGLADRVHLVGARSDEEVWALLGGADAFVFPSLYEGFGLPPLEAMACGVPVICSRASSIPEVVGDAGILVDPLNVEAFADAIGNVVANQALREELSTRAIQQASHFPWSATVKKTMRVYHEVLGRSQCE